MCILSLISPTLFKSLYNKYGKYWYTTICYTYSKHYRHCTAHSNKISILEKTIKELSNILKEKITVTEKVTQNLYF